MELPNFLERHADPGFADRLPRPEEVAAQIRDVAADEVATTTRREGPSGHPLAVAEQLESLGDDLIRRGPKWHAALGAFSGAERSRALDLLGFERQVIFSSLTAVSVFTLNEPDVVYAACRAHNSAMAEFCSGDSRLLGVGLLSLEEPDRAALEIDRMVDAGLAAAWIPADPPANRSPGHPRNDLVWQRLAETGLPFILHVGSSPLSIDAAWMDDGMPDRRSARGGAEVVGAKDMTTIYQPAERFISVLILDGVLERFPTLRGAVMELGAGWVPAMLRRLDQVTAIWSKSEPHLAEMSRTPSQQAKDQLRFTPYPFEDVGQLIEESDAELYLFSTDYPHAEGGRDPLARFQRSLVDHDEVTQQKFFAENFDGLFGAMETGST